MFTGRYQKKILVSLKKEVAKRVEEIAATEDVSRACVVRRLINQGLQQIRPGC
ncbi:MAG: ribbon-helix-helix protein, CopG family [Syntrophorhabdaceae bacterium]|nr:ribbon-helix-helix protein, CopG family [Syntrophorhabdaceae bacterium]